jgi:calcineurin-like phosphoesterase family protein
MDTTIIDNINSVVKEDYNLWCLGDWMFGRGLSLDLRLLSTRSRINCKNIRLVYGNHDKYIRSHKWAQNLFVECKDWFDVIFYDIHFLLIHRIDRECDKQIINKFNNQYSNGIVLSGHTHNNSNIGWSNMCVEVNNYKPVNVLDIITKFSGS